MLDRCGVLYLLVMLYQYKKFTTANQRVLCSYSYIYERAAKKKSYSYTT